MSLFCETCSIQCNSKRSYRIHLTSGRHQEREKKQLQYVCTCKRSFSTSSALYRHRKKCETHIQTKNKARLVPTQETEKESIKTNEEPNETVTLNEWMIKNMIQNNNDQIRILHETISEKTKENEKIQAELQSARATIKENNKNIKDLKFQLGCPAKGKTCRRYLPKQYRRNIIESQQNKCNICSSELSDYYEIDHIIAMQFGGTDELNNLQALCCECHARKSRTENKRRQQIKDAIYAVIYGDKQHENTMKTINES